MRDVGWMKISKMGAVKEAINRGLMGADIDDIYKLK